MPSDQGGYAGETLAGRASLDRVVEWCGKVKRDHDCVVMLAAMGLTTVGIGPGGVENDLRMSLAAGVDLQPQTAAGTR